MVEKKSHNGDRNSLFQRIIRASEWPLDSMFSLIMGRKLPESYNQPEMLESRAVAYAAGAVSTFTFVKLLTLAFYAPEKLRPYLVLAGTLMLPVAFGAAAWWGAKRVEGVRKLGQEKFSPRGLGKLADALLSPTASNVFFSFMQGMLSVVVPVFYVISEGTNRLPLVVIGGLLTVGAGLAKRWNLSEILKGREN